MYARSVEYTVTHHTPWRYGHNVQIKELAQCRVGTVL